MRSYFKRLFVIILAILSAIGNLFIGEANVIEGNFTLSNSFSYSLSSGFSFNQGLTTDGDYFYGFGSLKIFDYNAITKIDAKTGEIISTNHNCIPLPLMLKGYSHLGDGCYYQGKLFVACEDYGFRNPAILEFNAETLEFIALHAVPPEAAGDKHIPWCTIKDDILYFSSFDNVDEIKMLDCANDFQYMGSIQIDSKLNKVQSGEIFGNTLYISTNDGKKEKPIYQIDLISGKVALCFLRGTGKMDCEAEGMTISSSNGEMIFHLIDIGLSAYIRSYSTIKTTRQTGGLHKG